MPDRRRWPRAPIRKAVEQLRLGADLAIPRAMMEADVAPNPAVHVHECPEHAVPAANTTISVDYGKCHIATWRLVPTLRGRTRPRSGWAADGGVDVKRKYAPALGDPSSSPQFFAA